MSAAKLGNTNRLGTTHTAETKAAIGAARLGTTHTAETKAKMRGNINGFGNTSRLGIPHTAESIDIIRLNHPNRLPVYAYDLDNKLLGEFLSQRQVAKFLNVSRTTVAKYLDSGKVLNNKFLIRSSPFS
jgi:group I intron endonuclease